MARYDYRCPHCHTVFEVEHAMSETPRVTCPTCGAEASRVFEASSITLKGSGFYNTDMRDGKKGATPAATESSSSSSAEPSSADSSSGEPSSAKGSEGSGDSASKEPAAASSGSASPSSPASDS